MTKSETLQFLSKKTNTFKILPQLSFTVEEYYNGSAKDKILNSSICKSKVVIRSSAINEDTNMNSQAGKFLSLLNVSGIDNIYNGIESVIDSMSIESNDENQVFIQPHLEDIAMCGVIFTIDPNTLGNYYVINYDDITGSTSSVTSGEGTNLKTFYCFRNVDGLEDLILQKIINATRDVEHLLHSEYLDIEFAVDKNDEIYIFQARPLILNKKVIDIKLQEEELGRITEKIDNNNKTKPYLFGDRTIYGVMPDWNPAEMIGIRPKPLALSLYKRLITDGTWAYQRNNYGYKNLRSFPLMVDFCGMPYIDTRVSFNSFIPRVINEELSNKLVNYYLDELEKQPEKHDKVEFEIIYSCFTLDLKDRIKELEKHGFSNSEILELEKALLELTNNIIDNKNGLWKLDAHKIDILEKRYIEIIKSDLDLVDKIYWLIEDCTRYGTLPFAGLARAGFIAIQILHSFVAKDILSKKEYEQYLKSLNTVSSLITHDSKILSKKAFIDKYGHLRPGTYDIMSMRYDMDIESYFDFERNIAEENVLEDTEEFKLSIEQMKLIRKNLLENEINDDILALFEFLKGAIEGREYSKFIFTKSLSMILELLAELGKKYGFTREDMSYCNISVINKLYASSDDPRKVIENSINEEKYKYSICQHINLPPVIINSNQVKSFFIPENQPNFITMLDISEEIVNVDENKNIGGKLVLIKSADPGYDWIFSHGIKGFITAYGGANSHMAIRAGELGLPAVIGVGEKQYNNLLKANKVRIDCLAKKLYILG